jgi:hypothetical protein
MSEGRFEDVRWSIWAGLLGLTALLLAIGWLSGFWLVFIALPGPVLAFGGGESIDQKERRFWISLLSLAALACILGPLFWLMWQPAGELGDPIVQAVITFGLASMAVVVVASLAVWLVVGRLLQHVRREEERMEQDLEKDLEADENRAGNEKGQRDDG